MGTTRRQFAVSLAASRTAAPTASGRKHPNVLLIIADQWSGVAARKCGPSSPLTTPAIDRLGASGARFENSYCTFPLCSPSRASLFTGRMPHEVGAMTNMRPGSHVVPSTVPTLGEIFRQAGYDTGYFGKEHVGGTAYRGFRDLGSVQFARGGYLADGAALDPVFTRDAIRFIQTRRIEPFLAVVSLINPHDICYQPAHANLPVASMVEICTAFEWGRAKYLRGSDLPAPRPNMQATPPPGVVSGGSVQKGWTELNWRLYLATYYLLIENTDWLIGLLLDALAGAGLEKDTLVLFTADHGDQMGAHQLVGKGVFYEEAARVPFVLSWPGVVEPGRVESTALVSGVDVLPTLCDYAGVRAPGGMTGRSVRPLLEDRSRSWREHVIAENRDGRMVRFGSYKYVSYVRTGNPELLFDLAADPGETRNVAGSTPEVLKQGRLFLRNFGR